LGDVLEEGVSSAVSAAEPATHAGGLPYTEQPAVAEPYHPASPVPDESSRAGEIPGTEISTPLAAPPVAPSESWGESPSAASYDVSDDYSESAIPEAVEPPATPVYEEPFSRHTTADEEAFLRPKYGDFPTGGLPTDLPRSDDGKFATESMWTAED